jgi:hypothetical protein
MPLKFRGAPIALGVLVVSLFAQAAFAQGGATQTVLVLRGPAALASEDERLVEALRIYTRDRDCRLVVEGEAPAMLEGRAVADVLARARRAAATLVVWVGRRGDGRAVYYVLGTASGDLRETELAPLGAERTAVDVALKVRALLGRPLAPDADANRPAPDAGTSAPAAPAAPVAPVPAPPARPAEETTLVARPEPPPREEPPLAPERVALGAAYGVFLPTDTTWTRQGLVVSAEARVGRLAGAPVSLLADAGLVNEPTHLIRGYEVTLADVPLGLAALVRGRWGRVGAACGPRAGLHILDVSAEENAAGGRRGASRRYAAGLGGRVEADLRLFAHMKVFLGATFEALIPKQDFTVAGAPALGTGGLMVVGTAGVAVLIL